MGKEPNTVKSNLVGKCLDFSAHDTSVDFQPVDFQDECDSTILVRERTKGSKFEPAFARKSRKIQETPHTFTVLPGPSKNPKAFSKRNEAQASKEQKKKLNRLGKRAVIEESSSSSETEIPIKKEGKPTKWEKPATPEFAFDLENEAPSSIIDISSNTTGNDEAPKTAQNVEVTNEGMVKEEIGPKPSNCPEKPVIPVKATLSWQIEKRGPIRTSERRHIPPKRYGYDLITKEQEGQEIEEK